MPYRSQGRHRLLAGITAAALAAGGALLSGPASPAAAAPTESVTITPNPATAGAEFQGWGNSLVWFANATGSYPDELREELFDKVFGTEGLNMNMARYNFGGGSASDVGDYFRPGGAVPGFWAHDTSTDPDSLYGEATTNYADRLEIAELWDPENPDHYDWSQDESQRWWLEQLSENRDDLVLEGFVNSPPYFMTNSGYTSGNTPSHVEQMRTTNGIPEKFAKYIVKVAEHLEETYDVNFQTLTPFNEPCNGYWGTPAEREADGITPRPTASPNLTQEGAQICAGDGEGQQQNLINLLAGELAGANTGAVISANDETNPQQFNTAWKSYNAETRSNVGQINVHTYWDGGARESRDHSRGSELPLWMSETGGDFVGDGFDPLSMEGGVGLAQKITTDLRLLQPEAYILWQEVEDYYNMQQPRPRGENLNWGSIFIDFDCTYVDAEGNELDSEEGAIGFKSRRRVADALEAGTPISAVEDCNIVTNQKFNTMRNFMHFITAGDRLIQTNNNNTTAAVRGDGSDLSVVYTNSSDSDRAVTLDLSGFATIDADAAATPYVTTQAPEVNDYSTALVQGQSVAVDGDAQVTLTVPAKSVTTFEVSGVSGVADSAPQLADGQTYQLIGLQSSKALTHGGEDGLIITSQAESSEQAPAQTWIAHTVDQDGMIAGRDAVVLESVSDGTFAIFDSAGSSLQSYDSLEAAKADPAARWYPITEDGGDTWVLVNGFNSNVLEVGGSSTAENASVGWWLNNYGSNQRWKLRHVSVEPSVDPVTVHTQFGIAPDLPASLTPVYGWGRGTAVDVAWDLPDDSAWAGTGTVQVTGAATDIFGNAVRDIVATVEVGPITSVDPASVKVVAGTVADRLAELAPEHVNAQVGTGASRFEVPVTWDLSTISDADLAEPGLLTVSGTVTAEVTGGEAIPATLYIIVAEGSGSELIDVGCDASATFTEPGYSVANTCNGDRSDKAWSNWKSNDKNPVDTLTYQLDGDPVVRSATVYFYKDGSHMSFPESFQAQYQVPGSDEWVDAGEPIEVPDSASSPIVDVPLGDVQISAVQFVLTARENTHMIVSEVELYGPTAGPVDIADLARLTVGGVDVEGFDPEITEYTVPVVGPGGDVVAVPVDHDADVTIARDGDVFTITVTATDGTEKSYTLTLERSVDLRTVDISGVAASGSQLTANVTYDPAEVELSYQWLRDGEPIVGATEATFTPAFGDVGTEISVTVTAEAEGYEAAELTSETVTVADGRVVAEVGLASSSQSLVAGESLTLTATITPGNAGGTVQFLDGDLVLGTVLVSDGSATLVVSDLTEGSYAFTARFLPEATEEVTSAASELVSVTVLAVDDEDPVDDQDPVDDEDADDSDDGKGPRPDQPRPGLPNTGN